MRAVVFTLGCKVNKYESDVLAQRLRELGYDVYEDLVYADVYILNTCAVTAEAERKSRQAVARCRALNGNAKIFVCGCASEREYSAFKKDNVVFVSGTAFKNKIAEHLSEENFSYNIEETPSIYENSTLNFSDRTRAYVKIQDGCNSFCSYCIIPYMRGRSRSRSIDDVLNEIDILKDKTAEIVLTGINVMSYGTDIGTNLTELIKRLKNLKVRLRLSSFYAEGISEELLDALFAVENFCPHFHLSLQSGDDKVLKDMNRHYTTFVYADKIDLIRRYDENSCIATDIICGYPTEAEANFDNTLKFINDVRFSDLHVFPYSPREGTRAFKLPQLPSSTVKERRDKLLRLKRELHSEYLAKNIGKKQDVLIEERDGEYNCGYSQYYIKIYTTQGTVSDTEGKNGVICCTPKAIYKEGLKED